MSLVALLVGAFTIAADTPHVRKGLFHAHINNYANQSNVTVFQLIHILFFYRQV